MAKPNRGGQSVAEGLGSMADAHAEFNRSQERDAEPTVPVVTRKTCAECGLPTTMKPGQDMCLCAVVKAQTAVKAQALIREGEGWSLIELELPEAVAKQYSKRVDGPHDGATAIALLEKWVADAAYGTGR